MSAEGFEEVRGRRAEGTEHAGVPRPGRGRGGGGRPQLLLLTGVAGLLGRHDYRGYGASVSLTGATVATHPTTSRAGAGPRGRDWTVPEASSMLLASVHAFQHPLDFSELRFLSPDVRQRKLNPRRQAELVTRARKRPCELQGGGMPRQSRLSGWANAKSISSKSLSRSLAQVRGASGVVVRSYGPTRTSGLPPRRATLWPLALTFPQGTQRLCAALL